MRFSFNSLTFSILFAFFLVPAGLTSCRFKFPSVNEGQEFKRSGVFTDRVPAWVNQNRDEDPQLEVSLGALPQKAGSSATLRQSRANVPTGGLAVQNELAEKLKERKEEFNRASQAEAVKTVDEGSPLGRIGSLCPGLESQVSDALTTTDAPARIRQYENLTRRCPDSADLWLWLGKDYQSVNRLAEASRCFERVLLIDSSNEVAQALLSVVQEKLNEDSAGQ